MPISPLLAAGLVPPAGRQPIRWLEEAVCRLGEATVGRERHGLSHDDADDVTGTAATDDAIGFNPSSTVGG
jgi:hypothetical protein